MRKLKQGRVLRFAQPQNVPLPSSLGPLPLPGSPPPGSDVCKLCVCVLCVWGCLVSRLGSLRPYQSTSHSESSQSFANTTRKAPWKLPLLCRQDPAAHLCPPHVLWPWAGPGPALSLSDPAGAGRLPESLLILTLTLQDSLAIRACPPFSAAPFSLDPLQPPLWPLSGLLWTPPTPLLAFSLLFLPLLLPTLRECQVCRFPATLSSQ